MDNIITGGRNNIYSNHRIQSLYLILLILASTFLLRPVLSVSEPLVPSLVPISRLKPLTEFLPLGANPKLFTPQSAMNATFTPNGTMIFQFINLSREALVLDPPRIPQTISIRLLQNSSHVAYYLNRTGLFSAYLYFDFFSRDSKIKLTISGTISSSVAFRIPVRFFNGSKVWIASRVWCATRYPEDETIITGIGFDWSDLSGGSWDNSTNTFSRTISGSFNLDPSVVATTTSSTSTLNPSQNKAFFCPVNSQYYVIYLSSVGDVKYSNSSDGVSWTQSGTIASSTYGHGLDVAWNGSHYHMVVGYSHYLSYFLGTPASSGLLTISFKGYIMKGYFIYTSSGIDYNQYPSSSLKSGAIYNFSTSYGYADTYRTNITRGSAPGGEVFIFSPYANVTTSTGNTTFTSCGYQAKGWQSPITLQLFEAYVTASIRLKNPTTVKINGTVGCRLYKDTDSSFSAPKPLADVGGIWLSSTVNFSGVAGETKDIDLIFDCHNLTVGNIKVLENEWFYAQYGFQFSGSPSGETIQLEGSGGGTKLEPGTKNYTYVHITIDSDNYPWIGLCYNRANSNTGSNMYIPIILKINRNDGYLCDSRDVTAYKLKENPGIACSWRVKPISLTSSKIVALYLKGGSASYSKCYNGTWNSEETILCSDQNTTGSGRDYFSALAIGDTVHFGYINTSIYLNHLNWTSGTSWVKASTIASANATYYSAPLLIYDSANSKLRCFWMGNYSVNATMYYKLWDGGVSWSHEAGSSPWFLDTVSLGGYTITSSSYAYGSRCTVAYLTETSSPYKVNFAFINFGIVKAWVPISTWTFTLKTRAWTSLVTWILNLQTRIWSDVASWILGSQTRTWTTIFSWIFDPITKIWLQIGMWILSPHTLGWITIASWILSLHTLGWTTITIWIFTLGKADTSFLIIPILFLTLLCGFLFILAYKKRGEL